MTEEQKERQIKGYERMLDRLRDRLNEAEPRLKEALETVKERTIELGELTREEADKVADWIKRDLEEAAQYASSTERDYSSWLRMDLQLVENWIWDRFVSVADKTRLELMKFKHDLQESAQYHTGEIAGPGALSCNECGEVVHMKKAGHLPPCPKCHATVFERESAKELKGDE